MMDFGKSITVLDQLKTAMMELQDRLRKSEEEKKEMRVRLEYYQMKEIELQLELKSRTVVTRNMNTQTMDTETMDLPLAVSVPKEQSIGNEILAIRTMILAEISDDDLLESQSTSAGCSEKSSNPPDAESGLYLDVIAESSLEIHNTDMSLVPDSSPLVNLTRKQKSTRRKKENKRRKNAQKKAAILLEESLSPIMQEAVIEPNEKTDNQPNPVRIEAEIFSTCYPLEEHSTHVKDENCNLVESVTNPTLCDDGAQLTSEIIPAPEVKQEDVFADSTEFHPRINASDGLNGNATPFVSSESHTMEVPLEVSYDPTISSEMEPQQPPYSHQEPTNEYEPTSIYLTNLPYSVPCEVVALFLQHQIGPVKSFVMHIDGNGLYTGKATVHFFNPGDATRTLLLARYGLSIGGRQVNVKLYVNGRRMHAYTFPEDPAMFYPRYCFFDGETFYRW